MRVTVISIVIGALGTIPKGLIRGMELLNIGRWAEIISITEIGKNTEKSPGDLRRITVRQILVKDHQLMLVWKTRDLIPERRPDLILITLKKEQVIQLILPSQRTIE